MGEFKNKVYVALDAVAQEMPGNEQPEGQARVAYRVMQGEGFFTEEDVAALGAVLDDCGYDIRSRATVAVGFILGENNKLGVPYNGDLNLNVEGSVYR